MGRSQSHHEIGKHSQSYTVTLLKKPRLLIVLNRLAIGGPATNTLAVAAALSNQYEILLVAGAPLLEEQSADYLLDDYKGFVVVKESNFRRSVLPWHDVKAFFRLRKIIRNFKPDIVHTHGSKPGVLGRIAARQLHVPVIVHTYHGHVFHSYFSKWVSAGIVLLERWLALKSSALVAINEKLLQDLASVYRIAPGLKIHLNRLGVDWEKMQDRDGGLRRQFRTEFGLTESDLAIGIVGRLVPVKNHSLFVEAVTLLLQQMHNDRKLRFFIIGDGAEKSAICDLLSKHQIAFCTSDTVDKLEATVVFTSWRTDMNCVLNGLDIVMLTSLNEGTPVSIMEAMSAGRPVVATNVGGIAEMIQHQVNGFVCNNKQELAAYVKDLIVQPDQRFRMGHAASIFANQAFSIKRQANELDRLYHSLLDLRRDQH